VTGLLNDTAYGAADATHHGRNLNHGERVPFCHLDANAGEDLASYANDD
jgi:hypothetical protein